MRPEHPAFIIAVQLEQARSMLDSAIQQLEKDNPGIAHINMYTAMGHIIDAARGATGLENTQQQRFGIAWYKNDQLENEPRCPICKERWCDLPKSAYCGAQHGRCGICFTPRVTCKCMKTEVADGQSLPKP